MTGIDISAQRRIGRDWAKSLALSAICLCLVVAAVYGTQIEVDSYHDRRFRSGSFVFLPILVPFTLWVLFRLVWPVGALVLVGPEGFADRRVNPATVPWAEITNPVRRGQFISLTLSRRVLKDYPMSVSQRLIKAGRKTARPSHLLVADWCLAKTQGELLQMITAYRDAYSGKRATA